MKLSGSLQTLAALSVALLLNACGESEKNAGYSPAAPSVSVAQVVSERLTEWDTFTGRLEAPENVSLRPRVSGYIDMIAFEEGEIVKAGQPLFFIDNRPFKAEVRRYEAALKSAQARLELTASEWQRAQNLIAKDAISTEALDNRRSLWREAEANLESTKAALELARLQLSYTRVEAPITGRVSRAMVTAGNYVSAGQSVLTSLVSTDKVYAYFDADENTYLNYVKLAKSGERPSSREHKNLVLMGLANDKGFPYQGHIDFVDNQINPGSGTIRGRAVFDNAAGDFIPGLFTRIRLVGSAAYQGILIDDKAIGTDLNNKFVLILGEDNVLQYRAIEVGEKLNGLRIVKTGLQADDKIVVKGLQRVRPGVTVQPEEIPMANQDTLHALQQIQAQIDESYSGAELAKRKANVGAEVVGG